MLPPGTPRFLSPRNNGSYWTVSKLGVVVISTFSIVLLFTAFSRIDSHGVTSLSPSSRKSTYRLFNSTEPVPSNRFAIATLLTGQDADDDVGYFESVRVLTYQLVHAPDTRIRNESITWLVACSPSVPDHQKAQLQNEGALVIEVDDVPIPWWVEEVQDRWKETFTKLRFFEMTEFERLVFLDGDHMVMSQLDSIFNEHEATIMDPPLTSRVVADEAPLPKQWLFAGRAENSNHEHPVPPEHETGLLYLNSGFFMTAPDDLIFNHLMTVMSHAHRFDPLFPDQNLLNYVYRRDGPMPWRELDWKWNMNFPTERDADAGVATLHEKWWMDGPQPLRDVWEARRVEMEDFLKQRDQE